MSSKMSTLLCCFISTIVLGILCQVHEASAHKKHPFLTKIQNGQVYDCVDFYKQPTLKDPQLKSHFHEVNLTAMQSQAGKVDGLGLKDECPLGTVPILRSYNISKYLPLDSSENGEHCIATVRTSGHGDKFYGAEGTLSVYKPLVYGNQWSIARIKLKNEADFIEAGWMVNPSLYKDSEAHLYARFSSATSGGCFNLLCTGFVQVSKDVPLGIKPDKYSQIGQDARCWVIIIEKHQDDGNWWLSINPNRKPIGYWPSSLFSSSMKDVATQIEWGGEIDNPESDATPKPYMGSGITAIRDIKKSAFFSHIIAAVDYSKYIDDPKYTEGYSDCYNEGYYTLDSPFQDPFGRVMYFGGPYKNIP